MTRSLLHPFSLLVLAALCACGAEQPLATEPPLDACAGVDCGPGQCTAAGSQATCSCPAGYVAAALSCQRDVRAGDDHGDTPAAATPLAADAEAAAVFDTAADVDVFAFSVRAGRIYRFSCTWTGAAGYTTDCTVALSAGGPLVERVQHTDSESAFSVGFMAAQDGQLHAELRPKQHPGEYRYALRDLGPDDYADTLPGATPVAPGAAVSGRFELGGDVDVFALEATVGQLYRLRCSGEGTNCRMRLRDPDGASLGETSGNWDVRDASIELTAARSGRYTVELYSVQMLFSPGYGAYQYTLEQLPPA